MCENEGKSLPRAYPRVSASLDSLSTGLSTGENRLPLRKSTLFHSLLDRLLLLQITIIMNWVSDILKRYNLDGEYQLQRILPLWDTVVGDKIAQISRAKRFSHGTLWVAVSSPAVSQELSFFANQYIERLNLVVGQDTVKQIRFVPGRFKKTIQRRRVELSPEDGEEAHRQFSAVPDSALRSLFEQLYLTVRRREEAILSVGGKRCPACGVAFIGEGEICPGCRFDQGRD